MGSQVCATEEILITEDIAVPRRDSDVTAWVNVIHGCNERCTYCVVPHTRGQEQSRTADAIRNEMVILGEAGYKEVTLLGQNIDAYGRDLPGLKADGAHFSNFPAASVSWSDLPLHESFTNHDVEASYQQQHPRIKAPQ